jgi:microcystin-dependent protein
MPKVRRQYSGGAVATTIDGPVGASLVTTFNVVGGASPAGWPSSNGVPFFVVLSPQTSSEEKMLVTISGATLTIVSRALDGTSAGSHASGASIYPVFTATDADEANELTAKYAAQGSIVYQGASTFAELTIGTANHVLKVNSGVPQWGQITADGIGTGAVTSEKILNNTIALGDLATALQAFLVPVGTIVAYPGASAPTGWLLCNGTSTTGYTALAALVGATTPDFQGHTLVGKGSAPFNGALLSKFGSTTSTAAHTHEVYHDHGNQDTGGDSAEHTHDILLSSTPSGDLTTVAPSAGTGLIAQGSNTSAVTSSGRNAGHTHPVNILPNQVTSGDSSVTTAHGNVQPSALVNYIIKHD